MSSLMLMLTLHSSETARLSQTGMWQIDRTDKKNYFYFGRNITVETIIIK